jgi:aminobenzoyl-glutamate transport protein
VSAVAEAPRARGWLARIERLGNALPDPMTLFALGAAMVLLLSWLGESCGWSVAVREADGSTKLTSVHSLLSREGLAWLATNLVPNYIGFRPLGLVLCTSIGVAVAEKSGFLAALLRGSLIYVPRRLIAPATVMAGVCSSLASDAGFVVLPPLAAAIYRSLGRPAALGIATAIAGVCAGFGANVFLTGSDALIAGMTEQAARLLQPDYVVSVTCNWSFKIASSVLLMLVGWFVSERIVAPRLAPPASAPEFETDSRLTLAEKRGLCAGLIVLAMLLAVLVACRVSPAGFLHDPAPAPGASAGTPLWVQSIVALVVMLFFVPGLAYGIAAGTIRSDRDVVRMLNEYFGLLASYVVLAFFAALLVVSFEHSNLGLYLAVHGGEALARLELPRALLLTLFVLFVAGVDCLVVSMSAKWTMLATIFVPMFMRLGISPELTQAAYRLGDSLANPVSPLNMYLVIVLAFLRKHDEKSGLGTLIALLAPFALAFALTWIPFLLGWVALDLPLGPAGPLDYPSMR